MQSLLVFFVLLIGRVFLEFYVLDVEVFLVKMAYIKFQANKTRKIFFGGAPFNFKLLIFLTRSALGFFRHIISSRFKYVWP